MKITIRPILEPTREIDLTYRLTAAIAQELWVQFGGNSHLNWLEAELHLARIASAGRGGGSPTPAPRTANGPTPASAARRERRKRAGRAGRVERLPAW